MVNDLVQRDSCNKAEIQRAWNRQMSLRLEFRTPNMDVQFLVTESKGQPAFPKMFALHLQYLAIEMRGGTDVHAGEHKVVKVIYQGHAALQVGLFRQYCRATRLRGVGA
jgi:hypothetical protein